MSLQVGVCDDLVQVGITEDGEADIARHFYVLAEDSEGRRWAHIHGITAHRGRAEAAAAHLERLCDRIRAHLAAGGRLHDAHWCETFPAYGSKAYQGLAQVGYFRAEERARERERGDNIPLAFEDGAIEAWEDRPVSRAV